MFKLFVDGVEFAEEEDFGNAMELLAVLEETMPDSKFWVETPDS